MNKKELKSKLIEIKENDYKVIKGDNPFKLSLVMVDNIGDLDSELRDNLIYTTLATWIINDILTKEQILEILNIVLDENHIFYKIGEKGDSVFTRTFSVLILPPIIYKHRQNNFLSTENLEKIYEKLVKYIKEEKDLRGYVKKKGWAHGVAHAADGLDELAKSGEINNKKLKEILNVIKNKICINNYTYVNEEDERMVTAVKAVSERKIIQTEEIIDWINSFNEFRKIEKLPEDNIIHLNVKNFLRSLYFRLLKNNKKELSKHTLKVINEISKF
ncbi:MAG: DUF2785 domain-containing protein [Firmicutes bacterium]|nr:DUF2785 domain-containing protein [Bacillota bacterium]